VFEALIGADADAGNEIDPQSEANSPENVPKNTPANSLEQPATSESTDIAETLMKSVSDSARLGPPCAPVVAALPEQQFSSEEEPMSVPPDIGVRHLVPQLESSQSSASPSQEEQVSSKAEAIEPLAAEQEIRSTVRQLVPKLAANWDSRISVTPDGGRDSPGVQNQRSAFERPGEMFLKSPSPGPSGHPLPSGDGLTSLPPQSKQAAAAKSVIDDPSLLISNLGPVVIAPAHSTQPANLTPESTIVSTNPSGDANQRRIPERLNLAEFGVTRFEYKTETEPRLSPVLQSAQMLQMMRTALPIRETKPVKPASGFDTLMQNASSQAELSTRPVMLTRPDEVQHVHLVFEPPPPPPVVRSVSMDIGDPESQVRVVIRERDGNLNVQLGSTNERLREDMQVAGPMLMRELQRNNPMSVTLDFSNFGSATDAEGQSGSQPRAKKFLKADAEFADVVETAYLPAPSSELNSL
jgi:hypothetical protein